MGSSQRLAAVAAVSHARHYYNHTHADVSRTESTHYSVNIFFVSATLCGVLVAVCAACWRRKPSSDKPEDAADGHGVYTVSADSRLNQRVKFPELHREGGGLVGSSRGTPLVLQASIGYGTAYHQIQMELPGPGPGPPPAYESVVEVPPNKECHALQEVVTEPCPRCHTSARSDAGLPSYEAAVLLKDTKL